MRNTRTLLLAAGLAVLIYGVMGLTQLTVATAADEKEPCTQPCKDTDACKACCKDDCKACCKDNCGACDGCKTKAAAAPTEAKSAFVNTKCPIMGSKIDASKVTAELTREFNGQKVAFCCGGCLPAWDKLTDAQKQTKLDAAK